MTTFFMNLTLPTPKVTASSTWATNLNTLLTSIDSHSHVSGQGQRITSAGIGIDATLNLSGFSTTSVKSMRLQDYPDTTINTISVLNGDLYFEDGSSNTVQMTSGGTLAVAAGVGILYGDYASSGATVYYTDSTLSYTLEDSGNDPASISVKDIENTATSSATITAAALTANSTASLQVLNITNNSTISGAASFTGNTSGRGIIPVGAVVGLASNLTGVSLPSSFLELNGQTVSDAASPMNGVVLPNISNSNFLMGSTTAGTTGGAASYAITEANIASHTHTIDNSHSDTIGLTNTTTANSTHDHDIAHAHMWMKNGRSLIVTDDSQTTINSENGSVVLDGVNDSRASTLGASNAAYTVYDFYTLYTSGVLSPPAGSDGATATSGAVSATQTVTLSGSVTNHSGNSGSAGSGTAISLLPSYITTRYIIRYK